MKENHDSRFNPPTPFKIVFSDEGFGSVSDRLSMYDPANPDINILDVVDGELVSLAGSQLSVFKYEQGEDFDSLYDEHRGKGLYQSPVPVVGHYDPRPVEENLSEFGIELTNDQTFTFNRSAIDASIGRRLRPGDVIKPKFQNLYYEVFEVQEDSFEIYGVFHLVVSARLLRDAEKILPVEFLDTIDEVVFDLHNEQLTLSDGYVTNFDLTMPRSRSSADKHGFPLVVFIHGSGGSRFNNSNLIEFAAEYGFAGLAIDVRGQGSSAELNDSSYGHRFWDLREVLDVYEIIEEVIGKFNIDPDKVGTTGTSQGGILSFMLAKYSEKYPPSYISEKEWRDSSKKFPKIAAIAPSNWGGSNEDILVPAEDQFAMNTAKNFLEGKLKSSIPWDEDSPGGVVFDPDIGPLYEAYLENNDAAGVFDLWADPEYGFETYSDFEWLKSYPGHVHAFWAYDDAWSMGNGLLKAMQHGLPERRLEGPVRQIHFGTGGHQTPSVQEETLWVKTTRLAFFQALFKDKKLPIPGEDRLGYIQEYPQVRYGVVPNTVEGYQEGDDSRWQEKFVWDINNSTDNSFGPANGVNYNLATYYFGDNELLSDPVPPTGNELELNHKVNYGFSYADYYEILKNPEAAGNRGGGYWPMHRILWLPNIFGADPIMEEEEAVLEGEKLEYSILISGEVNAELLVHCEETEFQVGASLWDIAPDGAERFVTGGYASIKEHDRYGYYDDLPQGHRKVTMPFNLYTYIMEEGHTFSVKIDTTSFSRPPYPGPSGIFRVPPVPSTFKIKVFNAVDNIAGTETLYSKVTLPIHGIGVTFLDA